MLGLDNIRSGNLKVKKLKEEIQSAVVMLKFSHITKRASRQIMDGTKFLEMIAKPPYKGCRTVSELKKKISEERNKLKAEVVKIDRYMPGHQMNIFETVEEITEEQQQKIEAKKKELEAEIHWLHKCLGMCSDRSYFK